MLKRVGCLILALVIAFELLTTVSGTIVAEEVDTTEEQFDENNEKVYYSDLFYAYGSYLKDDLYLSGVHLSFLEAIRNILYEYIGTNAFKSAVVMHGLGIATDPEKRMEYITDSLGMTSFAFNNELDVANIEFVKNVCSEDMDIYGGIKGNSRIFKNVSVAVNMFKAVEEDAINNNLYGTHMKDLITYKNYQRFFVDDTSIAYYIGTMTVENPNFCDKLYDAISEAGEKLNDVMTVVDFAKSLALALAMSKAETELIQDIIDSQPSNSVLYKGMTKLKKQLKDGFISYFADTFIKDRIYEKIWEAVDLSGLEEAICHPDGVIPDTFVNNLGFNPTTANIYLIAKAVSLIIKVVDIVIFKAILQINYEDYTKVLILLDYTNNLYDYSLADKKTAFMSQFTNKDVAKYKRMNEAYFSLCKATLNACEKLVHFNSQYDETYLLAKQLEFGDYSYNNHIDFLISQISGISKRNRWITDFGDWSVGDKILKGPSDCVDDNNDRIYCPMEGIKANLYPNTYATVIVPKDERVVIDGNVYVKGNAVRNGHLINNGYLIITGNIDADCDGFVNGGGQIRNNGVLELRGDINKPVSMTETDSVFRLRGNYNIGPALTGYSERTMENGTIVFCGLQQQCVSRLFANNVIVENPDGIKCTDNIRLYGEIKLNHNPLVLPSGGEIIVFPRARFGDDSNYQRVYLFGNYSLVDNVKADFSIPAGGRLTIPDSSNVIIDGSIQMNGNGVSYAYLTVYGSLRVSGVINGQRKIIQNDGDLIVEQCDLSLCKENHEYCDWMIDTNSTLEQTGTRHRVCTVCGHIEIETMPKAVYIPTLNGVSLTLQNNLRLNFVIKSKLFKNGYSNPYMIFEMNEQTLKVDEYRGEGEDTIFEFKDISPDKMNDTITATLCATYNGEEYVGEPFEYSIAEYCYSMLGKTDNDSLRTLLVDMLNYGAATQAYTGHNSENPVNALLTHEQLEYVTNSIPALKSSTNPSYYEIENPTIRWKGASLNLNDSISIKLSFFADSIEDVSVRFEDKNGIILDEIPSEFFETFDSYSEVRFNGFGAGQMSEVVYATAYCGEEAISNTVAYSIESYVCAKQYDTNTALANLVIAMIKYGNAAKAYAL